MDKHIKLDIGAGDQRDGESSPEGFIKQDVDASIPGIDLVCNMTELIDRLGPESCSVVRASHVLEHFGIHEQDKNFKMLYDLLEPDGRIEIIVPNFKWHSKLVMEGREEEAVYYAFGGQLDEWDYHKYGFTPDILFNKLTSAGFGEIQIYDGSSIEATARKI